MNNRTGPIRLVERFEQDSNSIELLADWKADVEIRANTMGVLCSFEKQTDAWGARITASYANKQTEWQVRAGSDQRSGNGPNFLREIRKMLAVIDEIEGR